MEPQKALLSLVLFFIVVLLPVTLPGDSNKRLVIWNVGQGQWVTLLGFGECWHFDTGGERMNWQSLIASCAHRKNRIFLSHWDSDHIGFASQLVRLLPACLQTIGLKGSKISPRKVRMMDRLPRCEEQVPSVWEWGPQLGKSSGLLKQSNELSQVFAVENTLLPGDSPKSAEKVWAPLLSSSIEILLLGHHGSRTSTSNELLRALPRLKMAIASARFRRYGHPHHETEVLLRKWRIPLLRTEDWGTIAIEL